MLGWQLAGLIGESLKFREKGVTHHSAENVELF